MIYDAIGIVLALGVALGAWRNSARGGGYYDREIYGMNSATHVRYALVSLAFAGFFIAAYVLALRAAGIVALALYALLAVFYLTSFLRGAADTDE
ncbi:MAG TPA: hypothetical protein VGG51_07870 [Candidatus Cybelea sp.]